MTYSRRPQPATRGLLACVLVVLALPSVGAQIQDHAMEIQESLHTYFGDVAPTEVFGFTSDSDANDAVARIVRAAGLRQNFEVRGSSDVGDNAIAVNYEERRWILYAPGFINFLNQRTGSDWAGISVMAHEVGHHLQGHTITSGGSQPHLELEADDFSGWVLQRLGAPLDGAQAAMALIANPDASDTHPAKRDRLTAIASGWERARAMEEEAFSGQLQDVYRKFEELERQGRENADQQDAASAELDRLRQEQQDELARLRGESRRLAEELRDRWLVMSLVAGGTILAFAVIAFLALAPFRRRVLAAAVRVRDSSSRLIGGPPRPAGQVFPESGRVAVQAIRIGRGRDMDVVLSSPKVSRYHARLDVSERGYRLTDQGSTNGTRVSRGGRWQTLGRDFVEPSERLEFGDYRTTPADLERMAARADRAAVHGRNSERSVDDRPAGPVRRDHRGRVVRK